MTNDRKTCPVFTDTHKPAEAVHQIDEPQAEALRLADDCEESATHWVHEIDTRAKAAKMLRAQHARIAELEQRLEIDPRHRYDGISARDATIEAQDERIAELEGQLEAIGAGGVEPLRKQVATPIAWPKDAQDVRDFFHADFITAQFAAEDLTPCDEDRYLISAHGFLSAVNWWADFPHIPRTPGAAPSAAPVPDERAAFEAWLRVKPCGAAHDLAWSTWKARAALSATQPTQQGLELANCKGGKWLTVVYRDIQPGDEARTIGEHPKVSALSWSHALNDRDAALAAQAKQGEQP